MQQCAQCTKTAAASSSAQRLITALELPWPLNTLDLSSTSRFAAASASIAAGRSRRNRGKVHARLIHTGDDGAPSLSTSSSDGRPSDFFNEPRASTSGAPSTKKKHIITPTRHGQNTSTRRTFSTTPAYTREENTRTQARFIETPQAGQSPDQASTSTSSSPIPSGQKSNVSTNAGKQTGPSSPSSSETLSSNTSRQSMNKSTSNPASLQYLTEEVVQSPNPNEKANKKDEINTLLSYPTLFDPVRKPRHPIVLCHGLYGFDTWGLELLPALKVHYWADVLHVLKGIVGVDPVVVGVPGTGAITERAKQLHNVLCKDQRLRGKEVNLIGHSMGGLDCRHLLSNIRPTEYHPVSLTTLATPHRGSPFMAWCRANIGIGDIARAAEEASKEFASSSSAKSPSKSSEVNLPYSLKTPIFSRSKWQQDQKDSEKSGEELEALEQTKAAARQAVKDASSAMQKDGSSSASSKKSAITKTVINLPGINFSLGTSLASYLLDLLDSPAYSNLTSDYLESTFNPNTPNRNDVRYFSIAARAKKLPITHPLWLPKLIVDKAQEMEKIQDAQLGIKRPDDWQWGNDGLVPVESAKWGEFLGTLDNVDHWSIRGGAGFTTEPKTKKSTAPGTTTPAAEKKTVVGDDESKSSRSPDTSKETEEPSELERLGEKAKTAISSVIDIAAPVAESATSVLPDLSWSDINTAVFNGMGVGDGPEASGSSSKSQEGTSKAASTSSSKSGPSKSSSSSGTTDKIVTGSELKNAATSASSPPSTTNGNKDALKTLGNIADWIVKRIPLPTSSNKQLKSSIDPAYPLDDATSSAKANASPSKAEAKPLKSSEKSTSSVTNAARLLFGSSSSKSSSKSSSNEANKFDRERFYVALCKKLYDEGM